MGQKEQSLARNLVLLPRGVKVLETEAEYQDLLSKNFYSKPGFRQISLLTKSGVGVGGSVRTKGEDKVNNKESKVALPTSVLTN